MRKRDYKFFLYDFTCIFSHLKSFPAGTSPDECARRVSPVIGGVPQRPRWACRHRSCSYPSPRRGLQAVTFWSDRLALICSPSHPLASRRRIPLTALQGEKFIAFSPDLPTRREIYRRLRSEGVKVQLVLEFDNIETVKRAVEIQNGVSIVPETAVRAEVDAGLLATVEFSDPVMRRPLGALIRSSDRVSPALREFLALLNKPRLRKLTRAQMGSQKRDGFQRYKSFLGLCRAQP